MNSFHLTTSVDDPILARMLNADPFIPDPTSAQDYNRYSYVRNNPLKYTDPSGYMPSGANKRRTQVASVDFAGINGKLATDWHESILHMKMMGRIGVMNAYLEAMMWEDDVATGGGTAGELVAEESSANYKTTAVAIAALFSTFASPYYFYYW